MAARSERIDALRGFAVFGILLVNIWGFVYGFTLHGFPARQTPMPWGDQLAVFIVAAFAEQKFYPIFAFLFGAGFALQTGRRKAEGPALIAIRETYRRRLRWLLAVGILHGTLLWFGDILTAYAVTGFWLAYKTGRRLSDLVRSLRWLVITNVLILLAYGTALVVWSQLPLDAEIARVIEAERVHATYTQGAWAEVARMRLEEYAVNVTGFIVFVPRLALLFLLGACAVRCGYLTRPQRHRPFWRKLMITGLLIGVPVNLWWGLMSIATAADPFHRPADSGIVHALLEFCGPLLAAACVAAFMLARKPIALWLVPVGKMALTNYVSQSVVLMLLLQGVGLALGAVLTHLQLLALAAGVMLVQLLVSHWWMARHTQGPLEAVWRRYTYRKESV